MRARWRTWEYIWELDDVCESIDTWELDDVHESIDIWKLDNLRESIYESLMMDGKVLIYES